MKNKAIFTWKEIVELLTGNGHAVSCADMSSLITYSRQRGIGTAISYQKTSYSEEGLKNLKRLVRWWIYLDDFTIPEWRNAIITKKIQKIVVGSLKNNLPLTLYAVFCPSYKKGVGVSGYTGKLGMHTKRYIQKMSEFVLSTEDAGLKVKGTAFFSDLLLENYKRLVGTNYKKDLASNFREFKKDIKKNSKGKIKSALLSSIMALKRDVGEKGIKTGPLGISGELFNTVFKRNRVFYTNQLGWSEPMVKERTEVLARSYAKLGEYFRKKYPEGIMFWVESAYERGAMYSGNNQQDPIPIIYPKKDE
ncbi:hypothetical protein MUP46_01500 [Patescibacteria group bacterium]|nr:hypothetical protein [Patescibacteria group bacterium]